MFKTVFEMSKMSKKWNGDLMLLNYLSFTKSIRVYGMHFQKPIYIRYDLPGRCLSKYWKLNEYRRIRLSRGEGINMNFIKNVCTLELVKINKSKTSGAGVNN